MELVLPSQLTVAVDSEFLQSETLTIQAACRTAVDEVCVQIYAADTIPPFPRDFEVESYVPVDPKHYGRFCRRVKLRPIKGITPALSPLDFFRDLLCVESSTSILSRQDGFKLLEDYDQNSTDLPAQCPME